MRHTYNRRYYQHVTLKLSLAERLRFRTKAGIDVIWYPKQLGQADDEYTCTFICSMNNPDPLLHRNHDDIDKELSKYRVLDDNVKKIDGKPVPVPMMKIETIMNHPGLDHDLDFLRKKPKGVREVTVPKADLKSMNRHFEDRKAIYERTELKPDRKDKEGNAVFEFGEI